MKEWQKQWFVWFVSCSFLSLYSIVLRSLFSMKARTVPVPFCLQSFAVFPFDGWKCWAFHFGLLVVWHRSRLIRNNQLQRVFYLSTWVCRMHDVSVIWHRKNAQLESLRTHRQQMNREKEREKKRSKSNRITTFIFVSLSGRFFSKYLLYVLSIDSNFRKHIEIKFNATQKVALSFLSGFLSAANNLPQALNFVCLFNWVSFFDLMLHIILVNEEERRRNSL